MSQFAALGLAPPILKSLAEEGYVAPTPIQAEAIGHVLAGRDLLGIAQTGTGKTAAFALPILHLLATSARRPPRGGARCLVLSPTRELASQIAEGFATYGRHLRLSSTVVFGGVPVPRQERRLAGGVDTLVATPGRLLDLVDRGSFSMGQVEFLVLDEADQMLDLGFIHALKRIVQLLPAKRQTLFFSATMPTGIARLADSYLNDPIKVSVTPVATTVQKVDQGVVFVAPGDKQRLLEVVLSDPAVSRALVFTRTKHGADRVARNLDRVGIAAGTIHGNKSQSQRERALGAFRDGSCRVLIATDIAARGIDVDGVSHVVNFELPNVPESYVHRIGRTARAGATGTALSFCSDEERPFLREVERLTRISVAVIQPPSGFRPGMAHAMASPSGPAAAPPPRAPIVRSSRPKVPATGHRGRQGRAFA